MITVRKNLLGFGGAPSFNSPRLSIPSCVLTIPSMVASGRVFHCLNNSAYEELLLATPYEAGPLESHHISCEDEEIRKLEVVTTPISTVTFSRLPLLSELTIVGNPVFTVPVSITKLILTTEGLGEVDYTKLPLITEITITRNVPLFPDLSGNYNLVLIDIRGISLEGLTPIEKANFALTVVQQVPTRVDSQEGTIYVLDASLYNDLLPILSNKGWSVVQM